MSLPPLYKSTILGLGIYFALVGGCKRASFQSTDKKPEASTESKPSNGDEGVPGYFINAEAVTVTEEANGDLLITGQQQSVTGELAGAEVSAWKLKRSLDEEDLSEPPTELEAELLVTAKIDIQGSFSFVVRKVDFLLLTLMPGKKSLVLPRQSINAAHSIILTKSKFVTPEIGGERKSTTSSTLSGSCKKPPFFTCINYFGESPGMAESCQNPLIWNSTACSDKDSVGYCRLESFSGLSEEVYYTGHPTPESQLESFCIGMGGVFRK